MALFRCLKSYQTVNYNTGVSLGTTTTSTFIIPGTPIDYNSVKGLIFTGVTNIQSFVVNVNGVLTVTNITNPTNLVTAGTLNLQTGNLSLTWNYVPGVNEVIISFTGAPIYKYVTSKLFYVSCPISNQSCNKTSNAYLAASTICSQRLF